MSESYLTMVELRRLLELGAIKRYRDSAESRHRLVMGLFPKEMGESPRATGRVLFRAERNSRASRLLIRSSVPPAALPGVETLTEDFSHFVKGQPVAFRTTISPVKRQGSTERFIAGFEELEIWLKEKLLPGIEVLDIVNTIDETVSRINSKKNFVKLVQCDGVGIVNDPESLVEQLVNGVGRNKSYGAGLLTVRAV